MVEVASLGAEADQNIQKQAGKTLLHEAAEHNDTKDIKFLLEMGFDSNVQDQSEKTPSEYATENECRQAIENKRNLTTPDSSVGERNDYSNSSGDDSKAKPAELSDCNTEDDQDHDSDDSRKNEESEVNNSSEKLLLEKGADLNAQDQSGETLFEYATEDEYKGSSHSSDDPHENQENATDERHVSGGNDPTDKGNLTNDFSNDPNKHDEDSSCSSSNYLFLEDSLLAKLKIPLTTDEQKLTDKFCEEISGINKKEPKDPSYGLTNEVKLRNTGLFRLH
ncbi:ankyrin repeat domain-containing protein [Wolbachia endosymbiont of Oedothorax gibbosus]|uniref:ankyrin repeat domain-containing protein n=1 Tax=Wolbachia endosymbiont of Oedothorax gibbosus TaxID=931100 RepID=UPI00202537A0|nr:ankyrin repeat domain-containing protein [Wolbachia endosymbiont of Oedothorax gibbosus]